MQQPIEVEVDEDEQIVEWVAAVDVAKASGMVCTRVPHESVPGKRVTKVWRVRSTTRAIIELADHLRCRAFSGWSWSQHRLSGAERGSSVTANERCFEWPACLSRMGYPQLLRYGM
ncbi:MAG: hypothetical protein M3460_24160 [Actinomycetota bacterium]|nr:hypothetical protein [Actinomycetota bacterium]